MRPQELLEKLDHTLIKGELDQDITGVSYDSRKAAAGDAFVCIIGSGFDGHDAIADVIAAGVRLVVIQEGSENKLPADTGSAAVVSAKNTRNALAVISAAWFSHPAEQLKIIGITGTKGKTTTTYMIKSVLEAAGFRVGLIGTIETIIGETHIPAANTTPESYIIQQSFRQMVDAGLDVCVMEVSSQGLMMNRVDGFLFDIGVFTNLSPDHIGGNEHKDFEDYQYWKSRLFTKCRLGILNGDDPHYQEMLSLSGIQNARTYGLGAEQDYRAEAISYERMGHALGVRCRLAGRLTGEMELHLPGEFSVYNALCAAAICDTFGVGAELICEVLKNAYAKGRVEMIPISNDYTFMLDYAHNAVSLGSLLTSLRIYDIGRLVCVFGCGGNRSKLRRYEMGEVSGRLADLTIITSDNPRFEEPADIIADIRTGIDKTDGSYIAIEDRKEAVRYAIKHAEPGDVIVLAGKGHEDYQEIRGVKYPMSEKTLIREVLAEEGITPVEKI